MKDKLKKYLNPKDINERCGLILSDGTILEVDNVADEPERGFEIPAEKLLQYEDQLVGTWHTHPGAISNLSERDYLGFLMWPNLIHYIVGIEGVSSYKVDNGVVLNAD